MDQPHYKPAATTEVDDSDPTSNSYSVASLMLLMTLVSFIFGLVTIQPWVGVPLALVCEIAWLTVTDIVGRRAARRLQTPFRDKLRMFAVWFNVVLIFLALVVTAVSAPFLSLTFSNESDAGNDDSWLPGGLALSCIFVVPVLAIFGAFRLARYAARERERLINTSLKSPTTHSGTEAN